MRRQSQTHTHSDLCPAIQSRGRQEHNEIVLCDYVYMKRILYFFFSTDGKALISDHIPNFVGRNSLGQSKANHQRLSKHLLQGQV